MLQQRTECVDELSTALVTLERFETFFANYLNGRYEKIDGMPTRSPTVAEHEAFLELTQSLDRTKAQLLQHILGVSKKLAYYDEGQEKLDQLAQKHVW